MDFPRVIIAATAGLCGVTTMLLAPTGVNARCKFEKFADLDVNFEHGRPLVGVTINDKPGWMIFSNRSNVTSLYKSVIDGLSLKAYQTNYSTQTNGKESPAYGAHVDKFQVGGAEPVATDLFVVVPNGPTEPNVWGLLSTSSFPGKAIDYDYPNKKIGIYTEEDCEGQSLAYWDPKLMPVKIQKKDLATWSGTINGVSIEVQIDSNQGRSTINEAAVKLANLPLKDDPRQSVPVGGDRDKIAMIQTADIAGEIHQNFGIRVKNNPTISPESGVPLGESRSYDEPTNVSPRIVFGIDYLLRHHVLISPTQRLAYVSPIAKRPSQTRPATEPQDESKRP